MAILQGIPKSVFTWNFEIIATDHVGTMVTIPWNKNSAFFNLDGHKYELLPEGWFANNFILKRDSVILTTTKRESFFKQSIQINVDQRELNLTFAGLFTRGKYNLIEHGDAVGSISADNSFTRKCSAVLPDDLSLHIQVYLLSLVILLWRQQSASVACCS